MPAGNPNITEVGKATQFSATNQPETKGGRPKLPDLREVMAEILGEEKDGNTALKMIVAKLRQLAAQGNIKAAEVLLARGYGLPKQVVEQEIKGDIKITVNLSNDDNIPDNPSA